MCVNRGLAPVGLSEKRISSQKSQVKPQWELSSLSPTVATPRFSQSHAITPQVQTRPIQKPMECNSSPRESLYILHSYFCVIVFS
jgi:hypothetical protein